MYMTAESRALLQAVGKTLREFKPKELPTPIVQNEVHVPTEAPVVNVSVDMEPVANALDRFTEAMNRQSDLMALLIQKLPELLMAPQVRVNVESPTVNFTQPEDTLQAVLPVIKRKLRITHDDGTTTIAEEM